MIKHIHRILLGFCVLVSLNSCHTSGVETLVNFPETVALKSEELPIADVYLKYPFRVRVLDSVLYIMDIHPDAYYCHAFDYPSLRFRNSFAPKGEAPDEFLDAENIRLDHQGFLWALDANKKRMLRFSERRSNPVNKTVNLEDRLVRTLDFEILNDSSFIVPDYTGAYRINIINLKGEMIHQAFKIPATKRTAKNTPPIVLAQAWRPFLSYNPTKGILAMVTQLGQVLEIYDIQNDSTINVVSHSDYEPKFMVKDNYAIPAGIMGYSDVHVGKELIYALFWGHSFEDIKNGKVRKDGGHTIHVFTLDGTPKTAYTLDAPITGFHIDEKNKCIIGLDVNSNQPLKKFCYE